MFMQRTGKIAVASVMILSMMGSIPATEAHKVQAAPAISVQLDHVPLTFDAAPRIDQGVTYVPFRTVGEALGIDMNWNNKTKTLTAVNTLKGNTTKVVLQVGSTTATVNGTKVSLAAAPVQRDGRVLIPLSSFQQSVRRAHRLGSDDTNGFYDFTSARNASASLLCHKSVPRNRSATFYEFGFFWLEPH